MSDWEAFFLDAGPRRKGRRFCIHHRPQAAQVRGAMLYVHPFGDEMNKSRRMSALTGRALAAQGYAVLRMDLAGCGDSTGDFSDATWADWLEDVGLGLRWLDATYGAPLWLWGLRAGALLAAGAARLHASTVSVLWWQPQVSGRTALSQILRVRKVSSLIKGQATGAGDDTRRLLSSGSAVDVGGYRLNGALASGLEAASLDLPPTIGRVVWMDLQPGGADSGLSPVSLRQIASYRDAGLAVDEAVVSGPAFWQTTEIEDAPQLIGSSLERLA